MRNKISIDELVRQKVAHGEESHNLSAWANMERMLDGKNPYHKKEEKKRRPWMFMLLGAVLCSTAVIGGYNYLSNNENIVAQSPSNKVDNNAQGNSILQREIAATTTINSSIGTNQNDLEKTTATNTAVHAKSANNTNLPPFRQSNNLSKSNRTSNKKASNLKYTAQAVSLTKDIAHNQSTATPVIANKVNKRTDNVQLPDQSLNDQKLVDENVAKKSTAKNSKKANKNNIPPTITEPYFDTTKITEVTQKMRADEFGQKQLVSDSFSYKLVKQKKRTVVNPRFVALSNEQEEAAQRRTALASNDNQIASNTPSEIIAANNKANNALLLKSETTASSSVKKENKSFFTMFKQAGDAISQKAINITHTKYPIYAGMFVGVNAALINSKHNFGGFQGGFTAMTPLSRLLTLQAEARFIHKNNSGYTIKDSRNTIKNTFIDSTSVFKSKIYNYEIDSMSYGYNLKNFYTIQVPITLNANFEKFNVYGGVHLNYGFRMNVNTADKSFAISKADTVPIAATYQPLSNTETKFTRDDFTNRLGLGYTLGAAYNINSQLSLDLRMSNLFWDNTKGAAKQEISDVFFRIPSFQLSIGYRFRGYEKAP